jgi:hypothetical protein
MRIAAVGVYRSVFDVGLVGGGGAFSIMSRTPLSGAFELRVFGGRSLGGLPFADVAALGTATARAGALRFGVGLGLEGLLFVRATSGDTFGGGGVAALVRAGYDFDSGIARGVFVDVDVSGLYAGAFVWGPSLALGYRF